MNLKHLLALFTYVINLIGIMSGLAQTNYNLLWKNKQNSIFESLNKGTFYGNTTGYMQIINQTDTLLLDFANCKTTLTIKPQNDSVFNDNPKRYTTQTTSGKTQLTYETFMLANVLTLKFNGISYGIGQFDGACDTPIDGICFNYCHEKRIEYLSLYITKPLLLTTSKYLLKQGQSTFTDATKLEKQITILPGSNIIFTLKRNN